jgi:hypothetical protein
LPPWVVQCPHQAATAIPMDLNEPLPLPSPIQTEIMGKRITHALQKAGNNPERLLNTIEANIGAMNGINLAAAFGG